MKVQIVLFNGYDELDATSPFEVLQRAASAGADLQVGFRTLDGAEEITAAYGQRIRVGKPLSLSDKPDMLIVPGGGWNNRSPAGAWAEAQRGGLPAAIADFHRAGTTVASVCTGAMLLAAAGLTKGRPATTNHAALDELRQSGAEVVQARVVDDGDIITAGGVTSGLDLALWLVERYFGPAAALKIEQDMEYERRGTVWRR